MELIDGETLAERLSRGPLPLHELLQAGVQIAVEIPQPILPASVRQFAEMTRNQYATSDGKTFVLNFSGSQEQPSAVITVVQNWKAR